MIDVICPQEERYHKRLALAYVTQTLHEERESDVGETRRKLQQLLWESKFFDIPTVYGVWVHYRKNKSLKNHQHVTVKAFFFYRENKINNSARRKGHSPW